MFPSLIELLKMEFDISIDTVCRLKVQQSKSVYITFLIYQSKILSHSLLNSLNHCVDEFKKPRTHS